MKKINQPQKKKGFTLIETLVAIFILLISTTGPMSFAQNGLRASLLARDQVVAFYLAQDAIETVKSLRDNASIVGEGWLDKIGPSCAKGANASSNSVKGCTIETGQQVEFDTCDANGCNPLEFDSATNQFVLEGDSETKYTRTVYIKEIVNDREAQIIVEVSWDSNFFSKRSIVVQENIFNWVPRI